MTEQNYDYVRVPSNDWDILMETVALDGSYSKDIKQDVWKAMDNIKHISSPWIVFSLDPEYITQSYVFVDEESAKSYIAENNQNGKLNCAKADFYS